MVDRALRVSFLHRDGDVSVRSATIVNKRAPGSARIDAAKPGTGFWLELHDGERVIYRRLVTAQFEREAEVFGAAAGEPFTRVALTRPSEVELAIPLPTGVDLRRLHLVLTERRARRERRGSDATAAGRGEELVEASRPAETQHVFVALSDLADVRQGEN